MADLGIRVTQTGADEVKAQLLDIGTAGDASAKKVATAFQQSAQGLNVSQRAAAAMGITPDQLSALGAIDRAFRAADPFELSPGEVYAG